MTNTRALDLLRRHDPALNLEPLTEADRDLLRERITERRPSRQSTARRSHRALSVALAVLGLTVVGAGAAWAAGAWSPTDLFEHNLQSDHGTADGLWQQKVLPNTTAKAATIDLPDVGTVAFWYADTAQNGWCGAIQLPSGAWIGHSDDPLDGGGTVPGCYPTREQVNSQGDPVYLLDGFDYQEDDVDARKQGGSFWRIRFGKVTAHGAIRVTDLVSGRSVPVVHGDLFALAIPDPNPGGPTPLHLVAYDATGKVVAGE
jgi:hypothetical protein